MATTPSALAAAVVPSKGAPTSWRLVTHGRTACLLTAITDGENGGQENVPGCLEILSAPNPPMGEVVVVSPSSASDSATVFIHQHEISGVTLVQNGYRLSLARPVLWWDGKLYQDIVLQARGPEDHSLHDLCRSSATFAPSTHKDEEPTVQAHSVGATEHLKHVVRADPAFEATMECLTEAMLALGGTKELRGGLSRADWRRRFLNDLMMQLEVIAPQGPTKGRADTKGKDGAATGQTGTDPTAGPSGSDAHGADSAAAGPAPSQGAAAGPPPSQGAAGTASEGDAAAGANPCGPRELDPIPAVLTVDVRAAASRARTEGSATAAASGAASQGQVGPSIVRSQQPSPRPSAHASTIGPGHGGRSGEGSIVGLDTSVAYSHQYSSDVQSQVGSARPPYRDMHQRDSPRARNGKGPRLGRPEGRSPFHMGSGPSQFRDSYGPQGGYGRGYHHSGPEQGYDAPSGGMGQGMGMDHGQGMYPQSYSPAHGSGFGQYGPLNTQQQSLGYQGWQQQGQQHGQYAPQQPPVIVLVQQPGQGGQGLQSPSGATPTSPLAMAGLQAGPMSGGMLVGNMMQAGPGAPAYMAYQPIQGGQMQYGQQLASTASTAVLGPVDAAGLSMPGGLGLQAGPGRMQMPMGMYQSAQGATAGMVGEGANQDGSGSLAVQGNGGQPMWVLMYPGQGQPQA